MKEKKNTAVNKDGLLLSSEYMEFACRGVHHTYIHSDTQGKFMHTIGNIS